MAREMLTGARIRERRITLGLKQADLARTVGISASYLNLIEHSRRRIGGKLLVDIAGVLEVAPSQLTEGAGAALIAGLREAVAIQTDTGAELDRLDEFAGRFPGWAGLIVAQRSKIQALERTVETLSNRMTHDPHLAETLHEMLTTVTAIRSTATILAEPDEIDPQWQARFHRNVFEDSARLTETSRALVTYLEASDERALKTGNPQEEVDAVWVAQDYHMAELEEGPSVSACLERLGASLSPSARSLLQSQLEQYHRDAVALPLGAMAPAVRQLGPDALSLSRSLGAPVDQVMRRLAGLPEAVLPDPVGLAICDSSGQLTFRKPLPDFAMPRVGAGCPLWPLYRALNRPMVILAEALRPAGRQTTVLQAEAVAMPQGAPQIGRDPTYVATMLLRPVTRPVEVDSEQIEEVGSACRICPRQSCEARREPSVLTGGF